MATRARKLEILFTGDSSGLSRTMRSVDSGLGRTGRSFSRFGKIAAGGMAAGAVAVGAMVVSVGRDLANMERLQAQTNAAIRSTGGVANVSVRHVARFAAGIQAMSGIQEESIIEGQNMLLTFTNIRNEVGRGNDIFDQAASAATDLSVALGMDMSGAAMQVGKALNDPIAGLGRLQRIGVTFTDQQKAQVEQMMAVGDTAGAQGVILGELQREFGGSAAAFGETTAGQFSRIRESIGDVAEGLVVKLMPSLAAAGNWIRTKMIPALSEFADWLGPRIMPAMEAVVGWFQENWPQISKTVTDVFMNVKGVVTDVVSFLTTLWQAFGDDILSHIQRVWPTIQQIITGVMQIIQGVIHTVSSLIKGDWGEVWNGLKDTFKGVWNVIVGVVRNSVQVVRSVIGVAWQLIETVTKGTWRRIRTGLDNVWNGIKSGVRALKEGIGSIWEGLKSVLAAPVNWIIRNVVNPFLGFIRTVANFVGLGGHVPGPFGSIGGGGGDSPNPTPHSEHSQGGDGPGLPAFFSGATSTPRRRGEGDGLGDIGRLVGGVAAGPVGAAVGGFLGDKLEKVKDAIAGFTRLLGMTGGPPPYKGIMGATMTAPIRKALSFFEDLKKTLAAPTLSGGIGWEAMWQAVSGHFPGISLISSFRPGAITATGNVSYHARGRAIDISPRMDVFDWLVANYGKQSKEIIFSPAGGRQIWNGAPHMYGEPTRGDHWDHVHWAMAGGTPGWVKVKQPTAFVAGESGTEYMNISRGRPGGGGSTFHFHFHGPVSNEQQVIAWVDKGLKQGNRSPELSKLIRAGG